MNSFYPDNPKYDHSLDVHNQNEEAGGGNGRKILRELFWTIVQSLAIAALIIYYIAQATVVYGHSMEPNLHTAQRLIIEKVSYHFSPIQRQDIVVLEVNGTELPLIKRVIGLENERIEIRGGNLLINGVVFDEPYIQTDTHFSFGPVTVPPGHVFVMGDNRLDSRDSRAFGPIEEDAILGRAALSFWPLEELGLVK